MALSDEFWMQRCLELAIKGLGNVAPNPMVGCVIVHHDQIIGEGFHYQYGKSHAEVVAIKSVNQKQLLSDATLYVNLEPCSHFGKTPPCADLIVKHKIKRVVIGAVDAHDKVCGNGIQKLKSNNIEVKVGVMEKECYQLNKHFYSVHQKNKPYVYAKFAESADGFIGQLQQKSIPISNKFCNQLTHQLRSIVDGILIGKNTFINDRPRLNTRHVDGKSPKKFLLCSGKDTAFIEECDLEGWTILTFTQIKSKKNIQQIVLDTNKPLNKLSTELIQMNIQSLLIEGGKYSLEYFLKENFVDEIIQIQSPVVLNKGVKKPNIPKQFKKTKSNNIKDNAITFYSNTIA